MTRTKLLVLLRLLLIPFCLFGGLYAIPNQSDRTNTVTNIASDPRQQMIDKVDLDSTTYGAAIAYLNEISGEKILTNWAALAKIELTPQTPLLIDLHMKKVRLGEILKAVDGYYINPHPTVDASERPGFQPVGGLLVFTEESPNIDWEPEEWRTYDVTDLLENPAALRVARVQERHLDADRWRDRTPAERLMLLLKLAIGDYSSSSGGFRLLHGTLVVKQNARIQGKIERCLTQLRDMMNGRIPTDEQPD